MNYSEILLEKFCLEDCHRRRITASHVGPCGDCRLSQFFCKKLLQLTRLKWAVSRRGEEDQGISLQPFFNNRDVVMNWQRTAENRLNARRRRKPLRHRIMQCITIVPMWFRCKYYVMNYYPIRAILFYQSREPVQLRKPYDFISVQILNQSTIIPSTIVVQTHKRDVVHCKIYVSLDPALHLFYLPPGSVSYVNLST